jgi:DNA-binding transcriptional ArsR family regulator
MRKRNTDSPGPLLPVPALDLLADPIRRGIVWELAYKPRTVTELARRLGQSQPLISKHLRILRDAELVDSGPDPGDGRARIYDIRREQLIQLHAWIHDLEQHWRSRTRHTPVDPDYYKGGRLDPNVTTRGTPRIRNLRRLKDPWER